MNNLPFDHQAIIQVAKDAAKAIIQVKNQGYNVDQKGDESPVTAADFAASQVIDDNLKKLNFPIINEETKDAPFEERKSWKEMWLVDPLDGTKEFIRSSEEYTVNIAYVVNHDPVWGVIVQPENGIVFHGGQDLGSYKIVDGQSTPIQVKQNNPQKLFISRSHHSEEGENYIQNIESPIEKVTCGSSLKFCRIAEGLADGYPRFGPTMEWDTCAGQAILEGAGGTVMNWDTKKSLQYNKENLLNPFFIAKNKSID